MYSRERVPLSPRAPFPRAMGNRRVWTSVLPVHPAWHAIRLTDEVTGLSIEGAAVDEKYKCYLVDLSVPGGAVMSVCPATAILNSGSSISTMSKSVAVKLQAAVPDV